MSLKSLTIKDLTRRYYYGAGEHVDWPMPNELMGIELEAESVFSELPNLLSMAGWTTDRDGSLRNDGREFVLTSPLSGSSLTRAIHTLFEMQKPEHRSPLTYTVNPRAGTHVHINWTDNTVGSAAAMIALMYIIEPLVYGWADEDRAWCSYCNPLSDIPSEIINKLLRTEDEDGEWIMREIEDEVLGRYHGLNIVALAKYGSLEFRYFPSTTNQADMVKWVKFVQLAKLCALNYQDDVSLLIERLAQGNVAEFLSTHFKADGIDAELLTAVNDADGIVQEKAMELASILEMRPTFAGDVYGTLSPAARRYIERRSGGVPSVAPPRVEPEEDAWYAPEPQRPRRASRIAPYPFFELASSCSAGGDVYRVIDEPMNVELPGVAESYEAMVARVARENPELFGQLLGPASSGTPVADNTVEDTTVAAIDDMIDSNNAASSSTDW